MKILDRNIGPAFKPLIIAEIGINHNGDIHLAKAMVKAAHESGCECVKHQTHFLEDEMTDEAKTIVPPNDNRSIWEIMESCCLSRDEEIELKNYTESLQNFLKLKNRNNFDKHRIFDYRINNQLILK